jgi:hypothetical protein
MSRLIRIGSQAASAGSHTENSRFSAAPPVHRDVGDHPLGGQAAVTVLDRKRPAPPGTTFLAGVIRRNPEQRPDRVQPGVADLVQPRPGQVRDPQQGPHDPFRV